VSFELGLSVPLRSLGFDERTEDVMLQKVWMCDQFQNVVVDLKVEYVPLLVAVRDTMFSRMPSTCK